MITELQANHLGRTIEAEFSIAEPIFCDRGRMAQLFSNLLSNALTYGSEDQPVKVQAVSDEEAFELAVANAGETIRPATLSRIFEPFYRSGSEHSREGLGLGRMPVT